VCTDLGGGHFEHFFFVICDVINDKKSTVIKLRTCTVNALRQLQVIYNILVVCVHC